MMKLRISDSLSLPIDAVTQKFGILGRTGSGKSYAATKLAEEMLDAKAQVVVLDPVGVWWGLRVGDAGGFAIPILGGLHGDIPLEPAAGALIADLIVDKMISAVVDLSNFILGEQRRFATDFATQFFHRKKSQRSAVHLFVEEAQEFVPQKVGGDVARMVGAFERLLKLGRNFGIGATLISQRPQSVNKDVLNQTECLLAFQMTGPQERKTVQGWIAEKGIDEDIAGDLPHLKVGECHIWSPQWLQLSKTIQIATKKTADVSSTPKPGIKPIEPKQLSQIELENLSDKMLATIERAKQEDPKELRKQIVDLKGQLLHAARSQGDLAAKFEKRNTEIKRVEVPVLKDSQLDKLVNFIGCVGTILRDAKSVVSRDFERTISRIESVDILLKPITSALTKLCQEHPRNSLVEQQARAVVPRPRQSIRPRTVGAGATGGANQRDVGSNNGNHGVSLGIGERRCAIAIAQHPGGVTREQLTTLTGYKRSTRNTYLQRLLSSGVVHEDSGRFVISRAGVDWLGHDYEPLPTGLALRHYWLEKLPEGESKIFEELLAASAGLNRDAIGQATGYKRSTRNTYIQRLRARELVVVDGEMIYPSDTLFEK